MANTAAQVTEILWRQYAAMLNDGTVSEVVITNGIANVIGQQGVDTIAIRYRLGTTSFQVDLKAHLILAIPSKHQFQSFQMLSKTSFV